MRFARDSGAPVHLNYVTSAHPAGDVQGICDGLTEVSARVRERLEVQRLGLTLVLPSGALEELHRSSGALLALQRTLDRHCLEVTGLHGVPVGLYDRERRYGVFRPDWAEPERLEHTLRLARTLAALLPDDVEHGIVSTIPFFWRTRNDEQTRAVARRAFNELREGLERQAGETGRIVRVAMEPEPGCAIERSDEAADWLSQTFADGDDADDLPWVGLCLDTCHMSVQFEDRTGAVDRLAALRPKMLKLQLANALQVDDPPSQLERLKRFVDYGRLHQTRERRPDGTVYGVDDVSAAIPGGLPGDSEWRIHYHMPVYLTEDTTQDFTADVLAHVTSHVESVQHIETETYTWPMLPPELRPPGEHWIADGLALELQWAKDELLRLGFAEATG